MTIHIVVPARLASTRLPNKPLADIGGKPMIVRVLEQCQKGGYEDVIAAVDDEQVFKAVVEAGFSAELTRRDHHSGSDRVMEVVTNRGWPDNDIVVNVQGDEPLIPFELVNQLVASMAPEVELATVSEPIVDIEDFRNPNIVKVVTNRQGDALYFSRAPIPHNRDSSDVTEVLGRARRHVGVYAFRVHALRSFTEMKDVQLEPTEQLEQLRWLEYGRKIRVVHSEEAVPGGVDTPEDLARVRAILSA